MPVTILQNSIFVQQEDTAQATSPEPDIPLMQPVGSPYDPACCPVSLHRFSAVPCARLASVASYHNFPAVSRRFLLFAWGTRSHEQAWETAFDKKRRGGALAPSRPEV